MANKQDVEEIKGRIDKVVSLIKAKGDSEQYSDALLQYAKFMIQEGEIEKGLYACQQAKACIERMVLKNSGGTVWDLDEYSQDHGNVKYHPLEQYYRLLMIEAQQGNFESYMLYLEKNRPYKQRFYLPKKEQFDKIGIIKALQDMLDDKLDLLTISLPPGTGKTTLSKFLSALSLD